MIDDWWLEIDDFWFLVLTLNRPKDIQASKRRDTRSPMCDMWYVIWELHQTSYIEHPSSVTCHPSPDTHHPNIESWISTTHQTIHQSNFALLQFSLPRRQAGITPFFSLFPYGFSPILANKPRFFTHKFTFNEIVLFPKKNIKSLKLLVICTLTSYD